MAVLSHDEILKAIEKGEIEIEPYYPDAVGPASVDLTLSNQFRVFKPHNAWLDIKETTNYREETELVEIPDDGYFEVAPHTTCLAVTRERTKLSKGICALLEGRSRFARLGLFVHITASFMNPGIDCQQVREIYNSSNVCSFGMSVSLPFGVGRWVRAFHKERTLLALP